MVRPIACWSVLVRENVLISKRVRKTARKLSERPERTGWGGHEALDSGNKQILCDYFWTLFLFTVSPYYSVSENVLLRSNEKRQRLPLIHLAKLSTVFFLFSFPAKDFTNLILHVIYIPFHKLLIFSLLRFWASSKKLELNMWFVYVVSFYWVRWF